MPFGEAGRPLFIRLPRQYQFSLGGRVWGNKSVFIDVLAIIPFAGVCCLQIPFSLSAFLVHSSICRRDGSTRVMAGAGEN
jgi:hypothetical protein